jgi:hypothetical protein
MFPVLPTVLFPSDFPIETVYACFFSYVRNAHSAILSTVLLLQLKSKYSQTPSLHLYSSCKVRDQAYDPYKATDTVTLLTFKSACFHRGVQKSSHGSLHKITAT